MFNWYKQCLEDLSLIYFDLTLLNFDKIEIILPFEKGGASLIYIFSRAILNLSHNFNLTWLSS